MTGRGGAEDHNEVARRWFEKPFRIEDLLMIFRYQVQEEPWWPARNS